MTRDEVSKLYNIPEAVLKEYHSWGLCGVVKDMFAIWEYDERDLERLSLIMALHDIGLTNEAVEKYMRLYVQGEATAAERLEMLNQHRDATLDKIHLREKQIERLDYLRYEINKSK